MATANPITSFAPVDPDARNYLDGSIPPNSEIVARPGCDAYRINRFGTIWYCWSRGRHPQELTADWRVKKPQLTSRGYHRAQLRAVGGGIVAAQVHVLVLETFVGPCPKGMEALHWDGNQLNNHVDNMRWGTPQQNWEDRKRHGRWLPGSKNPQAKLTEVDVRIICEERAKGVRVEDLAIRFGVSKSKIHQVAAGINWKHVEISQEVRAAIGTGKRVGSRHPLSKLTEEDVIKIKKYLVEGRKRRSLAKEFGVSFGCIDGIIRGRTWAHIVI